MSVKIDLICWSSHIINHILHFASILFFMNLYMYIHIQSRICCSLIIEFFFSNSLQEFMWAWFLKWSILICLNRFLNEWTLKSQWDFNSDNNYFQWNDFNSCWIFMTSSIFFLIIESFSSIQQHDHWIFSSCISLLAVKTVFQDSKFVLWESLSCSLETW